MAENFEALKPVARKDDVVVQDLPDEILVYDLTSHVAHCLNKTAALVWNHCDGDATVGEIATSLTAEIGRPVDSNAVWLALEELAKVELLESPLPGPESGFSRREALRRLAYAAVAIPLVSSIVAPQAASAQSNGCALCKETNQASCNDIGCMGVSGSCYSDVTCTTLIAGGSGVNCEDCMNLASMAGVDPYYFMGS